MTKNEAKEKIKKLIARYERLSPAQIKNYNEATTRKDFIIPLFHALGWDTNNEFGSNEVIEEAPAIQGAVDYSFKLNNIPQFLLEAKALKVDLDKIEWAEQAINYAWNMGIDWVVLTDFEGLKLFNAEEKVDIPRPILEISYKEYLTKFDDLWLLSKEGFGKGELDNQVGRFIKIKRAEVTKRLATDLVEWRQELFGNFRGYNENRSEEDLDEAVQRILDRFIFIRSCEDRKIEEKRLWQAFQKWEQEGGGGNFIKTLRPIFEHYNEIYNSNLFREHLCEKLDTDGTPFPEVINSLYANKESGVKYDFKAIKPDVLGAVYEQYLGHLLEKAKKGKIAEDRAKRKKQGIYYTPTFIVNYIVENTLGKIIKEKSLTEIDKLKILDPACGSGSFLIKAFDVLDKELKERRTDRTSVDNAIRKDKILTNNLYGVDLDEHAIEITRLNLLLKAIESGHKLPLLSDNTKAGNSLISGTEQELKKYFGRDWKKKKAFNWEEQFLEVFKGKNPGFDVIVGNPPWGAELANVDKKYYKDFFGSAKGIVDTFALFIEKSLSLLKDDGHLGFILPDIILLKNYPRIRKLILENCIIADIYYTGMAFKGVNLDSVIIILKKEKNENKRNQNIIDVIVDDMGRKIKQSLFLEGKDYKFNLHLDDQTIKIKQKLNSASIKLGRWEIHEGIHSGNIRDKLFIKKPFSKDYKKLLFKGVEINKYFKEWGGWYVNYNKNIIDKEKGEYANLGRKEYFIKPKILVRRTGDHVLATIDEEKYFASNNFFVLYKGNDSEDKIDLKYILTILNSSIGTWYFLAIQPRKGKLFAEIKINHLKEIPIHKIDFSNKKEKAQHDELVKLADKMLKLNKELQKTTKKSDKWYKIKKEIEKTDKIIDEKIYKLYGLTKKEIKIIENESD